MKNALIYKFENVLDPYQSRREKKILLMLISVMLRRFLLYLSVKIKI